jgi:hypothetical protein
MPICESDSTSVDRQQKAKPWPHSHAYRDVCFGGGSSCRQRFCSLPACGVEFEVEKMASPWKFLARLVSPRRQQRQEHGSTDDVKSDVLAVAKPTETAANNGLNGADRRANEKPVAHEESAAVSADLESSRLVKAADPAFSDETDTAAHAAPKPSPVGGGPPRRRSGRSKKAKTIEVVSERSPGVPIVSNDEISLDGEIKLLRAQLARKLQIQNAQLTRMLERFER